MSRSRDVTVSLQVPASATGRSKVEQSPAMSLFSSLFFLGGDMVKAKHPRAFLLLYIDIVILNRRRHTDSP